MKTPKPGQLCTINNVVYRAAKRTNGCIGCALNNILICPRIVDSRNGTPPIDCYTEQIILKRLCKKNQ